MTMQEMRALLASLINWVCVGCGHAWMAPEKSECPECRGRDVKRWGDGQ